MFATCAAAVRGTEVSPAVRRVGTGHRAPDLRGIAGVKFPAGARHASRARDLMRPAIGRLVPCRDFPKSHGDHKVQSPLHSATIPSARRQGAATSSSDRKKGYRDAKSPPTHAWPRDLERYSELRCYPLQLPQLRCYLTAAGSGVKFLVTRSKEAGYPRRSCRSGE